MYLGLGLNMVQGSRARAHTDGGWDVPVAMNTAGLRGYDPGFARDIDGWVYVDMVADDNPVLAALAQRVGITGPPPVFAAVGYDLGSAGGPKASPGRLELTAHGVREGLELVKLVPSAEGPRRYAPSGWPLGRGALHGEYLVLRQ